MSCEFLQHILFLTSLSDDNAFGSVFKAKVCYYFLKPYAAQLVYHILPKRNWSHNIQCSSSASPCKLRWTPGNLTYKISFGTRYRLILECSDLWRFCESFQKKCYDTAARNNRPLGGLFHPTLRHFSFAVSHCPSQSRSSDVSEHPALSWMESGIQDWGLDLSCKGFWQFSWIRFLFLFFFFPREVPDSVRLQILASLKWRLIIISLPASCFQLPTPCFSTFGVECPRFQNFCSMW